MGSFVQVHIGNVQWVLHLRSQIIWLGVVMYTCNSSILKMEAGGLKLEASLGYIDIPGLKKHRYKTKQKPTHKTETIIKQAKTISIR